MYATHSDGAMPPPDNEAATFVSRRSPSDESNYQPNKRQVEVVLPAPRTISAVVDFGPAALVSRISMAWRGISGEAVRVSKLEAFEFDYCGPSHLLIAYHHGVRQKGDTMLDGQAPSTLHDLSCKLTFVPAGSRFQERYHPGGPFQATFLYIDPGGPLMDTQAGSPTPRLPPRVFFENRALWETSLKLTQLIEAGPSACCCYAEALGVVLAHELLLLEDCNDPAGPAMQGGLASWQQRVVAQYVEDNLDNHMPLTELAKIARLSPYHFSRAFKKSFGIPPRQYHMNCRIEWAKRLLAEPSLSITEIALRVGFADTSSFSVAFRKLVRRSPREYRRGLF